MGNPGVDVAKFLVANGANVNAKDMNGTTPLYIAAVCGATDVFKVLQDNGGDMGARNEWGSTPLDWAALRGNMVVPEPKFLADDKFAGGTGGVFVDGRMQQRKTKKSNVSRLRSPSILHSIQANDAAHRAGSNYSRQSSPRPRKRARKDSPVSPKSKRKQPPSF